MSRGGQGCAVGEIRRRYIKSCLSVVRSKRTGTVERAGFCLGELPSVFAKREPGVAHPPSAGRVDRG